MSYVPGCQYDLFISYAAENNRARWVERFKEALADELEELLGRQFSRDYVFFDKNALRVGQAIPSSLERAAEASALFVPILSPSYLSSSWCNREQTAFFQKLPDGASSAECLAPVLVRPVDDTGLIPLFQNAHRFTFLQLDHQEPWPAESPEWSDLLKKFAGQVMLALNHLRRRFKPVFLGRVPLGRDTLRFSCTEELQRRNFRVVPEVLMILDDEDCIRETLQQAALSLHFLGGAEESALRAVEIALDACLGPTILYQPSGANLTFEEELWLAEFEQNPKLSQPKKYFKLELPPQDLFAFLADELTGRRQLPPVLASESELGLVCDHSDLQLARFLQQAIQQQDGFTVSYPDFLEVGGTAMERKRKWVNLVKTSSALLFCWGDAQATTLLDKVFDFASDSKSALEVSWYLAQPNIDKKLQKYPRAICQPGAFNYEALAEFLGPLRRQRSAAK